MLYFTYNKYTLVDYMRKYKASACLILAILTLMSSTIIAIGCSKAPDEVEDSSTSNQSSNESSPLFLSSVSSIETLNAANETLIDESLKRYFGDGELGNKEGSAEETRFAMPSSICIDNKGDLIVFDTFNACIKRISDMNSQIMLGFSEAIDDFGFIMPNYRDGVSTDALFGRPTDGVYTSNGDLFITDSINHSIRLLRSDTVYTFAGGTRGFSNGKYGAARFDSPSAIAADSSGNLYITDTMNQTIRMITPEGIVSTIAGVAGTSGYRDGSASQALFTEPSGIAVDAKGVIYIADTGNHLIRKIENGNVSTIAGIVNPIQDGEDYRQGGYEDGKADTAEFNFPHGLFWADGVLFIADTGNHAIRALTRSGDVITIVGNGTPGDTDGANGEAMMNKPAGVVYSSGILYIADTLNNKIKAMAVDLESGDLS